MDRYDESKHVDAMRPDEEVRVVEREIVVSREDVPERDALGMRDADIRRERDMPRETDMSRDDDMPSDSDLPKRQGDILGLGGSEVPKSPDDPSATTEVDTTAHNRMRSLDLDEPAGTRDLSRSPGATGIDMGSGGSGTDLE